MIKKQLTITSFAIVASISLMLLASSALLPNQVVQAGVVFNGVTLPTFEKTLKGEGDCFEQGNQVLVKHNAPQTCHFQIEYVGESAVITDVVPAEWTVTGVMDDIDDVQCTVLQKGNSGKSATGIFCGAQTDITIMVWLETRPSPGGGHKNPVFKPTTCDEGFVVNDGAFATSTELDEGVPVFVEQSNDIIINAEDLNDLDCDGVPNAEDFCPDSDPLNNQPIDDWGCDITQAGSDN